MNNWVDKVNGYGVLFRFVLPILVSLLGWSLNMNINNIRNDITNMQHNQEQVSRELVIYQAKMEDYNNNHLEHHRQSEVNMAERLACIETELKRLK
jgi:hypothetical protein